eukprot:gb/GEZN01011094.1/.p1 GENE.gb/GEZN01011094.1/~~gb/GEZN01011094.1/.p1  ORF type:complete len:275 (+),score=22.47 gb/GEZN01011094.1/:21-845(+)
MSQNLTEGQNAFMGLVGGAMEVTMMQPLNYCKNAVQQALPLSLDPRVLYRGYAANLTNMASVTCFQFQINGMVKKAFTGGEHRKLSVSEQLSAGFLAGSTSALLCSPLELIMVQQQRKGGSLPSHFSSLLSGGHLGRAFFPCAMREGIYTAGYLGLAPVIREALQQQGHGPVASALVGASVGGVICSIGSHPFDTAKTCMQGDIERKTYRGMIDTLRTVTQERGFARGVYAGGTWRCARQICAVFILDKVRTDLSPVIFPDAFLNLGAGTPVVS